MKIFQILASLTLTVAATAAVASEPVTVFGLSLGGKLRPSFRQCLMKEIGTDVRTLCWISPPGMYHGWRSGWIIVPGESSRPSWAAHGSFEATVAKDGTLGELRVKTSDPDKYIDIFTSINSRFGPPSSTNTVIQKRAYLASWDRSDIKIELACSPEIKCYTTFTSPNRAAFVAREKSAAKAKEAARPLVP